MNVQLLWGRTFTCESRLLAAFRLCSPLCWPAAQPLQNQLCRGLRFDDRGINDQTWGGPGLVLMMEDILPGRRDEGRNVSFPGFHAPAVFGQVGANDFNLE